MNGDTTNNSVTITGLTSTTNLAVGMGVRGPGIPLGATVATIASSTSITMSVTATADATGVPLVFSLFSTTQSQYDAVGNVIETIDPLGNATSTDYDALNRPIQIHFPDITTTSKTYTPASLVVTEIDEAGSVTTHQYDAAARHIALYQPDPLTGIKSANSPLTQKGYDAVGNMTSLINPLGNEWTYVYDNRNRKTKEIDPEVANAEVSGSPMANPTVLTGYDGVGNVTSKTDPRGYVTTLEYDNANRLVETIYPAVPIYGSGSVAATTLTDYDRDGNILQVTDENGNLTVNTYDALNRLTTTTTSPVAGSSITTLVLIGATTSGSATISALASTTGIIIGMAVSGTGIASGATVFSIAASTVTLSVAATATNTGVAVVFTTPTTNIVEQFAYDPVGNRIQVTDGNELVTGFTYDGMNRLLTTQYDPGTTEATTVTEGYNALNKISRTDGESRVTQYSYDALNRLTDVVYPATAVDNLYYDRDAVGNVLLVVHPNEPGSLRDVVYTYDRLNRQLSEDSTNTKQVHSYDKAGNRLSTIYGGTNRFLAYTYDTLNREIGLGDSTSSLSTSYAYDLSGNIVQKSLGNGTKEVRTHDGRNRVTTLNNQTSGGVDVAGYAYGYDAAGNVMQVVEDYPAGDLPGRIIVNAYDGVYRLLSEQITKGWFVVTAAYTAVAEDKIQANTNTGSFTLTLPSRATPGDTILVQDATLSWNTNNLTIAHNGLKINGGTTDYTASLIGNKLSIVYISTTYGWSIK